LAAVGLRRAVSGVAARMSVCREVWMKHATRALMGCICGIAMFVCASAPALAHEDEPITPTLLPQTSPGPYEWTRIEIHLSTVAGIAILGALYLWGVGPLRRRCGWAERTPKGKIALFLGGLLVLFLSLNGPIHDLSDTYLFSAHMVQHLLLAQAVPPLLLAGTPAWLLRPLIRRPAIRRVARAVTTAPAGFLLYSLVFTLWHLPVFYNLMMAHHNVHIVMHLMVLVSATCMWWPVMGMLDGLPRPSPPNQILYLFLLGIPMMIAAAMITLADHVLYPWYTAAPSVWGLSHKDDQVLGGLIMWVPGGVAYWIAMTVVWFRWERRERVEDAPLAIPDVATR
jgi:putative membrane protein